jgi:rubrerythrin
LTISYGYEAHPQTETARDTPNIYMSDCESRSDPLKMEEPQKLIDLVKEQIEVEERSVHRLSETEKKVNTPAAKVFLMEMRLDSQKHIGILNEVLEIIYRTPGSKSSWDYLKHEYMDTVNMKRELEDHMKIEDEMMSHLKEESGQTKDEGIKLLLQHIADDEKKHHEILQMILHHSYEIDL